MDPKDPDCDGFRLRSYQAEMVDLSMKRNIIVTVNSSSSIAGFYLFINMLSDGYWKWKDSYVSE
jgi:hypothetical protein